MISSAFSTANLRRYLAATLFACGLSPLAVRAMPSGLSNFFNRLPIPGLTQGSGDPVATLRDPGTYVGVALAAIVDKELPIRLDPARLYPILSELPGEPFHPTPLALSAAGLYVPLPPGDYTLPVVAFSLAPSAPRPVAGAVYQLGPLEGKSADALGEVLWKGTLARVPAPQLQQTTAAILSGMAYPGMPEDTRRTLDGLIPQLRGALDGGMVVKLTQQYQSIQAFSGGRLPPLPAELAKLGPRGIQALNAMRMQTDLALDAQKRAQVFASFPSGIESGAGIGEARWTKTASGAYIRLRVTGGSQAANELQVRVPGATPGLAGASVDPASLFGARTGADGKLTVAGLVAYPVAGPAQVLNLYPLSTAQ